MKKAVALVLLLLILFMSFGYASHIEVTDFLFDPEEPQPGEPVTILIRLANKSYDQDIEVTCRLFINGELHDVKVVPVNRRSSSPVSFVWSAQPGIHTFSLETSYYVGPAEYTDTFPEYLTVPGAEEEIDYFSEALQLYQEQKVVKAKVMFEQAKHVFEQEQNIEQALLCEEYILKCDQYVEADQLFDRAEDAYTHEDLPSALTYYQQAKSLYQLLEDEKASLCEERIQDIDETQRKQAQRPYYLVLLLPVAAAVIAFFWLRRQKPPPPLPQYVPEPHKREKRLFKNVDEESPEIVKTLHKIESRLDTSDPEDFKSLVDDFKKEDAAFDKSVYTSQEADHIQEDMGVLKEKIKEKGKRLQDVQRLKDLNKQCDALLDQPVGNLVDAYNRYAHLHNVFDQIPDLGVAEQETVRAKLKEYYQYIQEQAKSGQSEPQ